MPTAQEFCEMNTVIARPGEPLLDIARRMRDEHVGSVVVMQDDKPIGIVTDRDIVVGVLARTDRRLDAVLVSDLMTTDLVTANADEDLEAVIKRMRATGVRRVVVIDKRGHLVGIVAFDDVLGYLQEQVTDLATVLANEARRERAERH